MESQVQVKFGAIIVLFNCNTLQPLRQIDSFKGIIQNVYVIDNSDDQVDRSVFSTIQNVKYLKQQKNVGIARALNLGFNSAIANGDDWVLTLDHDSLMSSENLRKITDFIISNTCNDVAIVSPNISWCQNYSLLQNSKNEFEFVRQAITSGCMTRSNAFEIIGGFNEDFFIDLVDTEFCLNIRKNRMKIIKLNTIYLDHQLGDAKELRLLNFHIMFITNHNYIRRYYITRNSIFLFNRYYKEYPIESIHILIRTITDIIKVLIFEKDKYRKLQSFLRGYVDGVRILLKR